MARRRDSAQAIWGSLTASRSRHGHGHRRFRSASSFSMPVGRAKRSASDGPTDFTPPHPTADRVRRPKPGHDPDPGRRPRPHPLVPGGLSPCRCGPLPLPHIPHPGHTTQQRTRTATTGAPPMTATAACACRRPLTVEPTRCPPNRRRRRCSPHVQASDPPPFRQDLDLSREPASARRISPCLNPQPAAPVPAHPPGRRPKPVGSRRVIATAIRLAVSAGRKSLRLQVLAYT